MTDSVSFLRWVLPFLWLLIQTQSKASHVRKWRRVWCSSSCPLSHSHCYSSRLSPLLRCKVHLSSLFSSLSLSFFFFFCFLIVSFFSLSPTISFFSSSHRCFTNRRRGSCVCLVNSILLLFRAYPVI